MKYNENETQLLITINKWSLRMIKLQERIKVLEDKAEQTKKE